MLTDRTIRLLLGAVAVLLMAHLMQAALRSPSDAQAAIEFPDTDKIYDVRLVGTINLPYVREVTPLSADDNGVNFVARTKEGLVVYRCGYFDEK